MSWEAQGRQYHSWFGHGTSGGDGVRTLSGSDVAGVVAAGASAFLSGELRAGYGGYLSRGGMAELVRALPLWAAGSGVDASAFRAGLVGPALGAGSAGALQEAGRLFAGARDAGDLRSASAALALAVSEGGSDWRYGLRYARDQAVYAAARGMVGEGVGVGGPGVGFAVGASVVGSAAVAGSGSVGAVAGAAGVVRAGLRLFGPWGTLAAAALGVGVGVYLYWYGEGDGSGAGGGGAVAPASPSGAVVAPMEPSEDKKDDGGAGDKEGSDAPKAETTESPGPGDAGAPNAPSAPDVGDPKQNRSGRLEPHPDAEGPHTTFKTDPETGRVRKYEEHIPQTNPRDPKPWESVKRYDGTGKAHYNNITRENVKTPHVKDPTTPGKIRPALPHEIPK